MRCIRFPGLIVLSLVLCSTAHAQSVPLKGMVWDIPDQLSRAVQELRQMHEMGVQAVRTGIVESEALLTHADTLGIQFFQDLPIYNASAKRLVERIAYAQNKLSVALSRAVNHRSARHFGLATFPDTADPASAPYFQALRRTVKSSGIPSVKTYYITLFPKSDRMAGLVDFVILDATRGENPRNVLTLWEQAHGDLPAALMIGKWVRKNARKGFRYPYSNEAQARYLETTLNQLLVPSRSIPAIFVDRWRDTRRDIPTFRHDPRSPFENLYGLSAMDGTRRPAFDVVAGIYSGRQNTFAFVAGQPAEYPTEWPILAVWIIVGILSATFAYSTRIQDMLPRYFVARRSFQEAIRRISDTMMTVHIFLLLVYAFGFGITGYIWIEAIKPFSAFSELLASFSGGSQQFVTALFQHPVSMVLILVSLYAFAVTLFILLLFGLSTLVSQQITPQRVIMSVVWAQWPILVITVSSILARYVFDIPPIRGIIMFSLAWMLLSMISYSQLLSDLAFLLRISRIVPFVATLVLLVLPVAAWIFFTIYNHTASWKFIWHLVLEEMV